MLHAVTKVLFIEVELFQCNPIKDRIKREWMICVMLDYGRVIEFEEATQCHKIRFGFSM